MVKMEFKFDPEILNALQKVDDAKKFYTDTIKSVQERCQHPVIHYQEAMYSNYGSSPAFVSCTCCGLTYFEKYREFGPFGERDNLRYPLQPKKMDYNTALRFKLGAAHNRQS